MVKEFRTVSLLCAFSSLLILIGFYATSLPPILQVILLAVGLGFAVYTLIGIFRLLVQQSKNSG